MVEDSGGNLFGTTRNGGASNDDTLYEVASGSGVVSILASFNGTNGQYPDAGLVQDSNGMLYGTASAGGAVPAPGAYALGTVFEVTGIYPPKLTPTSANLPE
jgi:uncharacterized repeat protein (TIGR03803 family)